MDLYQLTRALVDIPSVTGEEREVAQFLQSYLNPFADEVQLIEAAPDRYNVYARVGAPTVVTLTTHIDTVPPFFASSEDETHLYGRGSCDAKGIAASMIKAFEELVAEGRSGLALLFVVGEERGSEGALHAGKNPLPSKYLINGEPTENALATGTKGALRLELRAKGKMAHSAYPELGDSAIEKLLDALQLLRKLPLPYDSDLGQSTLNIGTITAGRAPNVIPDAASAEVLIRLVDDADTLMSQIRNLIGSFVEVEEVLRIEAWKSAPKEGFDMRSMAYTTDIPAFGPAWGEPFLLGPGSIHVAHTSDERIAKADLTEAVALYKRLVIELLEATS